MQNRIINMKKLFIKKQTKKINCNVESTNFIDKKKMTKF